MSETVDIQVHETIDKVDISVVETSNIIEVNVIESPSEEVSIEVTESVEKVDVEVIETAVEVVTVEVLVPGIQGPPGDSAEPDLTLYEELEHELGGSVKFKEITELSSGDIDIISYYDNAAKDNLLYTKQFSYTVEGDISTIVLTRVSDSESATKTFLQGSTEYS